MFERRNCCNKPETSNAETVQTKGGALTRLLPAAQTPARTRELGRGPAGATAALRTPGQISDGAFAKD